MKVDELRKEIENNSLKNVYLVLGEDTYLNNKVKENIILTTVQNV